MKQDYIIIDKNTQLQIKLVNATLPSLRVYTEKDGVKTKGKCEWNPIQFDYAEIMQAK
jgi:hypothetical protein